MVLPIVQNTQQLQMKKLQRIKEADFLRSWLVTCPLIALLEYSAKIQPDI